MDVTSFERLDEALMKCKAGVMWKDSPVHYVLNELREVWRLSQQLQSGEYRQREARMFSIYYPKPREIVSVSFRDRIYQRSLNDNILYPTMTRTFIYANLACQIGKGPDAAMEYLRRALWKHYCRYGTDGAVLQFDIHHYYPSMQHDRIKAMFRRYLDDETYSRVAACLDAYPGDVGYNPGSQMVQIAGLSALSPLDHFIKERLKIRHYMRYMDDGVLIHPDEGYLRQCLPLLEAEVQKAGFSFNAKKTRVYPLKWGIDVLGFRFRLTETGKVLAVIRHENVNHARRKLRKLAKKVRNGEISAEDYLDSYKCWRAHAMRGNSHKLLRRMDRYCVQLLESGARAEA